MRPTIALLFSVLLFLSCSSGPKEKTAADDALYHQAAVALIDTFSTNLKAELVAAIDANGPAGSIEVCQIKAPELASTYSVNGWSVRRVTDRFRNPANAADSKEQLILAQFAAPDAPSFIEQWDSSGNVATYRFYQPIRTSQLCLNCHGTKEELAEGVIDKVRLIYPDDHATGYELGDLRGMFVVRGHWPEGEKAAKSWVAK
jgi:hypothetical protein